MKKNKKHTSSVLPKVIVNSENPYMKYFDKKGNLKPLRQIRKTGRGR